MLKFTPFLESVEHTTASQDCRCILWVLFIFIFYFGLLESELWLPDYEFTLTRRTFCLGLEKSVCLIGKTLKTSVLELFMVNCPEL